MPLCHHTEPPAPLPSIALSDAKLGSVFRPVLAEVVAVLDLPQVRLGMLSLQAIGAIPDKHVRRVGSASPTVIMIRDLDRLLFIKLNIRIKIEQQEKVALEGGLKRSHRLCSGVGHQTCEAAVVLGDCVSSTN